MVGEGDRVELESPVDNYGVSPGDRGTVTDVTVMPAGLYNSGETTQVWVNWDSGEYFALVVGDDEFRVIGNE